MKRFRMLMIVVLLFGLVACSEDTNFEDNKHDSNESVKPTITWPMQTTEPEMTEPTWPDDETRPSYSLLLKDLQDSLTARIGRGGFDEDVTQTISDVSVVLSQTEEKLYVASISVAAQSVYADFTWPVDVTYTKYDQGWVITDCTWGEYTYQQVRYPSEEEVQQMAQEYAPDGAQWLEVVYLSEEIRCLYKTEMNWSKFAEGSCTCEIKWEYSEYSDAWKYPVVHGNDRGSLTLTKAIEGTWELYEENDYVIINNVTETGFDLQKGSTLTHYVYTDGYISKEDGGLLVMRFTAEYNSDKTVRILIPKYTTKEYNVVCDFFIEIKTLNYNGVWWSTICNESSKVSEYAGKMVAVHVYLEGWSRMECEYWGDGSKGTTGTVWGIDDGWNTVWIPGWADTLQFVGDDYDYGECDFDTGAISIEAGCDVWIVVNEQNKGKVFYQKPTLPLEDEEFPGSDAISDAIDSGNITVKYFHDGGVGWPFIVTTFNGETCIKASNSQIDSSHAILYANVELKAGQAVGFDYIISSEQDMDIAYVVVNGQDVYQMSGHSQGMQWKTCYPWVALEDGTYQLVIIYLKDGTGNIGDDTIYIDNLRIVDAKDIDVDTYIPRQAAVENKNGEFTYVDIFYNEADGYYHVGSVDGPLLLANLLGFTQFCYHDTIYNMAFNGEIIKDGHDYYEDLAPFVSESPNTFPAGYCAVTKELAEILKVVAEIKGYEGTENEWLKICMYYEDYGPGTRRP